MAAEGDDAEQRQRIERERATVEAQARAGERECARRFAVTSCLNGVREERRAALQRLDHQLALLDDAQRKQRAAARQARIGQRHEAQARQDEQRLATVPKPVNKSEPTAKKVNAVGSPKASRSAAATAREAGDASRRAEASRRRAEQAAEHRESAQRRKQERTARRTPQAPLPAPEPTASAPTR